MRIGLIILIFSVNFIFFSSLAFAQFEFYNESIKDMFANFFGIPSEWLIVPTVIYNLIIPFIAILVIALGFLRQMRIFANSPNIEITLAFVMAFSTLPSRVFVQFVAFTLAVMGGYAYLLFIALFFIGSAFFSLIRFRGWKGEAGVAKAYNVAIEQNEIRLQQIHGRLQSAYLNLAQPGTSPTETQRIHKEIEKLEKQEAELLAKIRTIRESYH